MLVDCLPLVIVVRMRLPIRSRDRLRSLVGLEPQIAHLMIVGILLVAEPVVAKHQVVVRLQVLGIDLQHGFSTFTASANFRCRNSTRPRSFNTTRSRGYWNLERRYTCHFARNIAGEGDCGTT